MVKKQAESYLERVFDRSIQSFNIPAPTRQHEFKGYRFDFAWIKLKIAVEIDGGTFIGGNHVRGKGYQRDCIKNNLAQVEGWAILRADREMVGTPEFALIVRKMIQRRINIIRRNMK